MLVCESNCTACGACKNICPTDSVFYHYDLFGVKKADIDNEKCLHCDQCKKTCPIIDRPEGNLSFKCYAAWSLDTEVRNQSASGGLATEMYKYAAQNGWWFVGTIFDDEKNCVYDMERNDPYKFYGSKYTYSDTKNIFREIEEKLKMGEHVLFIGLPCHVAALKKYMEQKHLDSSLVLSVDLVCHGVVPEDYLKSHISYIENRKGIKAEHISFRDPESYTYTFTFALRNSGKVFYRKKANRNDLYQIGYHKGIIYRDNCYNCCFANEKRQGDLTLADFGGVGSVEKCEYDNKNVSCVLANTQRRDSFLNAIHSKQSIFMEERPINEEYSSEARLHTPTPLSAERSAFLKNYEKYRLFERAMNNAARKIIIKNETRYYFHIDQIRTLAARILPSGIKKKMKGLLKLKGAGK